MKQNQNQNQKNLLNIIDRYCGKDFQAKQKQNKQILLNTKSKKGNNDEMQKKFWQQKVDQQCVSGFYPNNFRNLKKSGQISRKIKEETEETKPKQIKIRSFSQYNRGSKWVFNDFYKSTNELNNQKGKFKRMNNNHNNNINNQSFNEFDSQNTSQFYIQGVHNYVNFNIGFKSPFKQYPKKLEDKLDVFGDLKLDKTYSNISNKENNSRTYSRSVWPNRQMKDEINKKNRNLSLYVGKSDRKENQIPQIQDLSKDLDIGYQDNICRQLDSSKLNRISINLDKKIRNSGKNDYFNQNYMYMQGPRSDQKQKSQIHYNRYLIQSETKPQSKNSSILQSLY